jgi:hypothetical protein
MSFEERFRFFLTKGCKGTRLASSVFVRGIRVESRNLAPLLLWLSVTLVYPIAQGADDISHSPVTVGVRGGIHLIDWFKVPDAGPSGTGTDESSKATVGPFVSVRLPARLAVQFEGLRRGYGFTRAGGRLGFFDSHDEAGSAWEIPALLVWRPAYQENGWQPYVGAGPALRYVTAGFVDISRRPQLFPTDPPASETRTTGRRSDSHGGIIGVAGMEHRYGPVVVSAEFRYAYWTAKKPFSDIVPNHSQASVLFAIRSR